MRFRHRPLEADEIQLTEPHQIAAGHPWFAAIDTAAFAAKNLWNAANYLMRQAYIHEQQVLSLKALYRAIKPTEAYQALPRKVLGLVLLLLKAAWSSFFKALAAWRAEPTKFLGQPRLPKYKPKTDGRNLLVYDQGGGAASRAQTRVAESQGAALGHSHGTPNDLPSAHRAPTGAFCGRNCLRDPQRTQ
jgi:hypothetical protein